MGDWSAVALANIRSESIEELLRGRGMSWDNVCHSTATTSLTRKIRTLGGNAHPLASLIDLAVLPGLPGDLSLPLDDFPQAGRGTAYEKAVRAWQAQATGRRIRIGIQFDQALRGYVRKHAPDQPESRALVAGRRELARSIHTLSAAGLEPAHFKGHDPLTRLAASFWAHAEATIPGLSNTRDHLWVDPDEVATGSTEWGRTVRGRILAALEAGYGPADGRRLIVHHGFYFYTPPQWALFQLLRQIAELDQLFVVHDDGTNPSFETWRRFFEPVWGMPPVVQGTVNTEVTSYAAGFRSALDGRTVAAEDLKGLRVLDFKSPAELVREWAREDARQPQPLRFAADAPTVARFARRLGRNETDAPNLAQLPVGAFLLGLHDCIRAHPGQRAEVALTFESLLDVVATGYLPLESAYDPSALVAAMRRSRQFFYGCDAGDQWRDRAGQLVTAVEGHVAPLRAREPGLNDVERIRTAVANPLRLVPWGDLSPAEARLIESAIAKVVEFAEGLAKQEAVRLGTHIDFIRSQIERGLRTLGEAERAIILGKLGGFPAGMDEELDAEGLVDVVSMLLGQEAEFDALGDDTDDQTSVGQLRSLDALALTRAEAPIHAANLSETNFPASRPRKAWPFELAELKPMAEGGPVDLISGLLELRESAAALSDLYLTWVALDGADAAHGLTFSWLSKVDGESQYLSPLVGLLTLPGVDSQYVRDIAGGIQPESPYNAALSDPISEMPTPVSGDTASAEDAAKIAPEAAASALACARRTALQWILGPSGAFEPDYLQEMLYGNVVKALIRQGLGDAFSAPSAANALWRYLTDGQRQSSLKKAVVKETGRSAHPSWVLSLAGRANGTDPLDRAYHAAKSRMRPTIDVLLGSSAEFLPAGIDHPETCKRCPVQSRCAARATSD